MSFRDRLPSSFRPHHERQLCVLQRRFRALIQRRLECPRFTLRLSPAGQLQIAQEEHEQLQCQVSDPRATPAWSFYYRRVCSAQSDVLFQRFERFMLGLTAIIELVLFHALPLDSTPLSVPAVHNSTAYAIVQDHRYDSRCFVTTKLGPCVYCRQQIRCRRCAYCNEYTFCSEQCNRLGYRHFHKGACRAVTSQRVAARMVHVIDQGGTLIRPSVAYDQYGVLIRYRVDTRGRPSQRGTGHNMSRFDYRVIHVDDEGNSMPEFDFTGADMAVRPRDHPHGRR
jgi:hypothetical protein